MRFKEFLTEVMSSRESIKTFLENTLGLDTDDYTINDDTTVELYTDLSIERGKAAELKRLPVKFSRIDGSIWLTNCRLETLIGLPEEIGGGIFIINSKIKDLNFCPKKIGDVCDVTIQKNKELISLDGCPEVITNDFSLSDCNALTSLVGGPKEVKRNYKVDACNSLTSIEGIAEVIGNNLVLSENRILTSLAGISKMVHSVGGILDVSGSRFKSAIMGLLRIKGMPKVLFKHGTAAAEEAFGIIFKCREEGKDDLDCQEALIDAGLEEFAKL